MMQAPDDHKAKEDFKSLSDQFFPDVDPGEKPIIRAPKRPWSAGLGSCAWILSILLVVTLVAWMFDLTEREVVFGMFALLTGLGLGEVYGQKKARRADERDPVMAICRTVETMNENALWVFTRQEEQAIVKLQRILKVFREKMSH